MATMVILDIDDTLIAQRAAEHDAAELFGTCFHREIPGYDARTFSERWHEVSMRHFDDFLARRVSFAEQRRRRIREIFSDPRMPDARADERFSAYRLLYEGAWRLFPDVPPFLAGDAGLRFAALSDGGQLQQEYKLEKMGIRSRFEFVLTAESMQMAKPDREFFLAACARAGTRPGDTYYIGDNLVKDALGAKRAGLNGVWLNRDDSPAVASVPTIRRLTDFRFG